MTEIEAPPRAKPSSLPMMLTLGRIAAAPLIAALILWAATFVHVDHVVAGALYALACGLFIIAAASDWLDGYLARKLNSVTPLGAALDHCADKVLVACALAALAYAAFPIDLAAAAVLIIGREFAMAGLREGFSASGRSMPVSQLGKWKAAAEMAGVSVYLGFQAAALMTSAARVIIALDWSAHILIWAAAVLALVSAAHYAWGARRTN